MEFLTVLIVLGVLQYWGSGGPLQRDDWFTQLGQTLQQAWLPTRLQLLLRILLPLLAVVLLQILVDSLLFGLLSLLLYISLLLFSLGRGDFSQNLQDYLQCWQRGDTEAAYRKAVDIGDFKQSDAIGDGFSLHQQLREAFVYEGYQRWFAVVFWFLLIGPVAAVAYRLSYLAARQDDLNGGNKQLALRFVHYLDFVPARLLAFSFSLAGDFNQAFAAFRERCLDNLPSGELLDSCALAAINQQHTLSADTPELIEKAGQQLLALQSLLSRSVICWLAVTALLTLFS